MYTKQDWPVFTAHGESVEATCFNCGDSYDKATAIKSGNAPGHGEYYSQCLKCGMRTWYDLKAA